MAEPIRPQWNGYRPIVGDRMPATPEEQDLYAECDERYRTAFYGRKRQVEPSLPLPSNDDGDEQLS
jgi:hypothetical protein